MSTQSEIEHIRELTPLKPLNHYLVPDASAARDHSTVVMGVALFQVATSPYAVMPPKPWFAFHGFSYLQVTTAGKY